MRKPILGAACLFRGARLVIRPGIRHFAWIPLLINVLVFAGLIWLSGEAFDAFLERYLSDAGGIWGSALRWLAWLVFSAAMVLISFLTFTLAANLVASPFNEALAAAVSRELGHRPGATDQAWTAILAAFPAAIGQEITKWLYFARWLLPALILFLVPGVQILAPFIWLALAAWFVALEYIEFPASSDDLDFKALRRRVRTDRGYLWGFGGTVLALALVPGFNLVLMPVAVAGATVLYREYLADDRRTDGAPARSPVARI
ncbi:MAG: sulfate transporter CysZ [Gammaproteobacteria bacterium]|nr:sulfate transporter CysZ [Gammaproteobacteria bacterium]